MAAALATLPASLDDECSGSAAIRTLLLELREEMLPPEPDHHAVELLDWLEVPLDDAPVVILTGFNEGFLPASVSGDAFLPDALRSRLGLLDNRRRLARDAYRLTTVLHSKQSIHLVAGRRSVQGDPLRPSRLMFQIPEEDMAARVLHFLDRGGGGSGGASLVSLGLQAGTRSRFSVPPDPVIELAPGEVPTALAVTAFRPLLADPYRFVLERVYGLDTIDDIAMRETGQPARVAIGSANAWPYSWYLRDRANLTWFDSCMGPPTDGSADVIIIDRTLTCTQDNTSQEIRPQEGFLDYQSTLFAMRSWWVPTYNDAGPLGWIQYARDRTLWEQNPNPGFVGVGEVAEDLDSGIGATLDRLKDGADASANGFIGFVGADGERLPEPVDPGRFVEADDGRDGCGSVDQWFLVHNRFAFSERVVDPEPIDAMVPLPCASDQLSAG